MPGPLGRDDRRDRKRFCDQCDLHVHDISALRREQAAALLRERGDERTCIRMRQTADGRLITRRGAIVRAAGVIAGLLTGGLLSGCDTFATQGMLRPEGEVVGIMCPEEEMVDPDTGLPRNTPEITEVPDDDEDRWRD